MKPDRLSGYLNVIPPVFFLTLAGIFSASHAQTVFEPRFLLAFLNSALLFALPLFIAILAARSYARQGLRVFIMFGCGMVAFGLGSLLSGWGLVRFGENFSVTVHNTGCLIGGICHLGAVSLLLLGSPEVRVRSRRRATMTWIACYSALALCLLAVSWLAINGAFPAFITAEQGPTPLRQIVLTLAAISYALSAVFLVSLHARTNMMFLSLYANGLFLTAIGLAIVLSQGTLGGILGWTGRTSQYAGSIYLIAALVAGRRETRIRGTSLPEYLSGLLRSHLDDQVKLRTKVEDELRLSHDELESVYDHSPVMMCILNADSQVLYANRAFSDLVGVPEGRLIGGRAPGVFGCADAADKEPRCGFGLRCGECEIRRVIEDTLTTGRAHYDVEYRAALEREGVRRDAWFLSSTVRIPGGPGLRLLLTLLDITDRKAAEEKLRESEALYRTFIDDSLQGFAIIQDGRIVLCNDALCRMSGYSRNEIYALPPQEVLETVHTEDRSRMAETMRQTTEDGKAPPAEVIRLLKKGGGFNWVEMLGARTTYHGRPALQISYVNRTEEIRAEAAYHSLFDHAMNGIALLQNGRIIFANQALADICGYSVEELLRLTPEQLGSIIQDEDRGKALAKMSTWLAGRAVYAIEKFRFIHKDGSVRWVETQVARIDHEGGLAIQVSIKDATVEKAAEEQLELAHTTMRNLAVHLLHVREEERRNVAQEIHDELGQTLAALKMDLHWLAKRLGGDVAALRDKVRGTIQLGEQALSTVQRIASDLRPRMLDDLGLEPALDWLGADFARRTKIACKVTTDIPPGVMGKSAATALYRIAQEALANVGRHSHGDHAAVRLYASDAMLILQIEDDGIGITADQAAAPDSYGLIGIRERVEGLRGSLSISGELGFGTILLARIPLPKEGGLA